jgi:hypothetical protein
LIPGKSQLRWDQKGDFPGKERKSKAFKGKAKLLKEKQSF